MPGHPVGSGNREDVKGAEQGGDSSRMGLVTMQPMLKTTPM